MDDQRNETADARTSLARPIALGTIIGLGGLGGLATALFEREETYLLLVAVALILPALVGTAAVRARRTATSGLGVQWREILITGLLVASLVHVAGRDLVRWSSSDWLRVWNVFHYYLGAEYFPELGYHDLYEAVLAADEETVDYWSGIDRVRDLHSYERRPRDESRGDYRPETAFSDERWQRFQADVAALQTQMPPRQWRNVFTDRGYNVSPFWTAIGQRLTAWLPADRVIAMKVLTGLDLALFVATFLLIGRTYDRRIALCVALLFLLSPVNTGRMVGGFLQYDWFCAIAAGICWWRTGRPTAAALALAYATLARVFPVALVASALVPALVYWVRSGRIRKSTLRFGMMYALALGVGFVIGCGAGRGVTAWKEFGQTISHHTGEHLFGQRRIGLQHVFTHAPGSNASDEGVEERRQNFARQRTVYQAGAVILLGLWGLATWRRRPTDALLLGLLPIFALTVASRYYWATLALLPLLARPGPSGRRRWQRVVVGQLVVLVAYWAYVVFANPERYGAYVWLNVWLTGYLCFVALQFIRDDFGAIARKLGAVRGRSLKRGAIALLILFVGLCALRLPLPEAPIRDVDEAVSALIAQSWLEGGVPYRDAIDQRGPVTYAIYAAVFALAGAWNMTAVHWALLALIFLGACLVWWFSRRLSASQSTSAAEALIAAGLFAVSTFTYRRSQMLAFHTEWPAAILSLIAMILVWRGVRAGKARPLWLAGLLFGGAFLSKQPAVFDGMAAGGFVICAGIQAGWRSGLKTWLGQAAALAGGFGIAVGLAAAYFAAHGALSDAFLYFWSYNTEHYTAVVSWVDRLVALVPWEHRRHYLTANPLLLVVALMELVRVFHHILTRRRIVDARLLLLLWLIFGYFGASYSGRNFGHYFIQIIAPACLLAARWIVDAWSIILSLAGSRRFVVIVARTGLIAGLIVALAWPLFRFRKDMAIVALLSEPRTDSVRNERNRAVERIRELTGGGDSIFVWGYEPELYVLAPRRPATRYSNANYLVGMLPWENHRPGVHTSEHIVPGSREILIEELSTTRPRLIIDTSVGDRRYWSKYPLAIFPELERFIDRNYRHLETLRDSRGRPAFDLYERVP